MHWTQCKLIKERGNTPKRRTSREDRDEEGKKVGGVRKDAGHATSQNKH